MGMEPNVASLLAYVLGWLSGLVIYLMEKENLEVRFHAAQSIIVFGALTVLNLVLGAIPFIGWILVPFVTLAGVVLWVLLMIKGYNQEHYKLPMAGDYAEKMALSGATPSAGG